MISCKRRPRKLNVCFVRLLLWLYRIYGISFGGVTLNNSQVVVSKKWRFFSYLGILLTSYILLKTIFYVSTEIQVEELQSDLHSGSHVLWSFHCLVTAINLHLYGNKVIEFIFDSEIRIWQVICILVMLLAGTIVSVARILAFELSKEEKSSSSRFDLYVAKLIELPIMHCAFIIVCSLSFALYSKIQSLKARIQRKTRGFGVDRKSFVALKNAVGALNSQLGPILVTETVSLTYYLMIMLFLTVQEKRDSLSYLINTIAVTVELVAFYLVCDLPHSASEGLADVIDGLDVVDNKQFRELAYLQLVCRKTSLGFTAFGFRLTRQTLISVLSFILTYLIVLFQTTTALEEPKISHNTESPIR